MKGLGYGARHPRSKSENGAWRVGYKHGGPSTGSGDDCGQGACGKTEVKLCKEQTKRPLPPSSLPKWQPLTL